MNSDAAAAPEQAGRAGSQKRPKTLWAWAAATFFGIGLLRPGPGTWGSLAAGLMWLGAGKKLGGVRSTDLSLVTLGAAAAAIAVGVAAGTRVEREGGRKDPGYVVIDEVAGQWIALLFSPPGIAYMASAFLLFRGFDIIKPWPARRLEKLPGGWGIVFDDVAAGIYALIAMQLLSVGLGGK